MPPPWAHDAHPVSPPLSGFIAKLGIDAEHNKRWIKLFPRAVQRLECIWWNVHVLSGLELGIDAEHNKRWIKLFPRAVRRLEFLVLIYGNISVRTAGHSFGHGKSFRVSAIVLHILYGRPKTGMYMTPPGH
ncbi:hypothetical protein WG66_011586 [Moniliophthora roreri]|nr:hypothetical protein WG66_011586 [Moniliophthora roreri]